MEAESGRLFKSASAEFDSAQATDCMANVTSIYLPCSLATGTKEDVVVLLLSMDSADTAVPAAIAAAFFIL